MKVWLKTNGRATPKKDARVRICGLVYIVTGAEEPTELDEETIITECDVQPSDTGGKQVINAELVLSKKERQNV